MGLRNDFCLIFPCSRDLGGFCCYFHCYHLFFLLLLLLVITPKLCHTWVDVCPSFGWESGSFKDSVQAVACLLFFFISLAVASIFKPLLPPTPTFSLGLWVNSEQAVWLKEENDLREMSRGRWRSKQNRNRGRFQEQQA